MPKLTVDGKTVEVPSSKRLVNALTEEAGIDQLHSCVANLRPNDNCCKTESYALR